MSLPSGPALTRGLLMLARSARSGVLTLITEGRTARVGVQNGRVVAVILDPFDDDPVGDALRRMGAWDEDAANRASPPADGEPLGRWALRVGATDARALSLALRKQVQRRIGWLFGLDPPELRLAAGRLDLDMIPLDEAPSTSELIVSALRDRVAHEALFSVRRKLGEGLFLLTPLGHELLADAVLWPDEQAMIPLLEAGAPIDALLAACHHSPRAQRTLYALKTIGACGPPEPRAGYAVLLRKTRQVRRAATANELLDLPLRAGGTQARRALRRLARTVHPDRFGSGSPPAIRDASLSVMTALNRASRDLG